MLVQVQPQYQNHVKTILSNIAGLNSFFELNASSTEGAIFIGDLDYLEGFSFEPSQIRVLVSADKNVQVDRLQNIAEVSRLYVIEPEDGQLEDILLTIKSKTEKKSQISQVKSEIQKKRKELEELNSQLSNENEKKIQSLEKSHVEESEKNRNEKSLLHFLDFIQSESVSYDFLEKLFRFIWKDLKKMGRVHLIGLGMTTQSGKSKILFFDGSSESTTLAPYLDFKSEKISNQLASVWGRPVGKVAAWQLPEISRESFVFIETVDQQTNWQRIKDYFAERLAITSMYIDRWMIEKETEVVVDRWKNTFKSFPGFTHVVDEDFRIYQANYPFEEKSYCYKLLAGRETPCESCPIIKNKNTTLVLKNELTMKTYFSQFRFQHKKFFFVIYEDITKMNLLHMQIIQTEKMSTLGRLGNHLAHELNNPLTGVKSYVQTLLEDKAVVESLPNTATSDLNEILKATVRCQKIIKNFIDFSQKKEPSLEEVSFDEILQNTIVLLKTALRSHRLFIDLKDDRVRANAHDLQQVLFNLIKNSCQAMKDAGTIKVYSEVEGDKILFHVEDSGDGFDEAILKNIFQPFMTTKAQGEGTGLGLYLSKKLMNNMGADLRVSSAKEKGAKISLVFDKL
ncbi:sensor histidine kinase [Pseudobdellovibrio exovorus]|uniref:histidine kinase n=1 Tax=Pseudobdellovibrio exovorus JSS TaxID=1184267 RepID=M4VSV9_9BACT|nr:HAMP domain-containing sensor histidine kinase [Pseudobdellovibrio exovorus]AGH96294.1 putative two-component sensor histidine kinase [Pseudobdellovibrio exovorus JSS]